jgi:cytochrome P450
VGGLAFAQGWHSRALVGPGWLASLRLDGTAPSVEGKWLRLITGYDEACQFLIDRRWSRAAARREPIGPASAMSVTEMDPPRHTVIRGLLSHTFSSRSLELMRSRLEHRAAEQLAVFVAPGPPADLVGGFAAPFAFTVHCDLLGVPEHSRPVLYRWSLTRAVDPDSGPNEIYAAEVGLHWAVTEVLDYLRRDPREGLLGELIAAQKRGILTETELRGVAASLFFDGHVLAGAQIANGLLCLLTHRDQLRGLRADSAQLVPAVEEVLRFSPSITVGMTRIAAPQSHRCGAPAVCSAPATAVAFGLVNRDPTIFGDAHRFDITRTPNRHLSFGRGIHHCLGACLMRLELDVAVTMLLNELPGLDLAVDERHLAWSASHTIRGLHTLPLTWSTRSHA